jgi:NAD(P)-dependent dehydrogenase (short-subunit alcohol dehydrogenase family)
MKKDNSLNGRWAVITGAAGGIGKALVGTFAKDGYRVIASDFVAQPDDLACTHYLQADLEKTVCDELYAQEIFQQIHSWINGQGIDALINNAAVQILAGVDSLTRQDWQTTLNVNLLAPFIWIQALLPQMEAVHGCVVNISSIHAKLTKKNFVAYATSKAALSGMSRSMAIDLGRRIRVNAIEPAAIETEMLKNGFDGKTEQYIQLEQCHPQLRIGQPEEVAALALTLTKGNMKFLNGCCIGLDGGIASRIHDPE